MLDAARQRRNGRILHDLEADGYRPRVQEAYRDRAVQAAMYAAGRTEVLVGFHNLTGPGGQPDALAADVLHDDAPLAPGVRYCLVLAVTAERWGCETGIGWGLPDGLRRHLATVLAARAYDASVKVGWDPCHVQIRGLTLAQALDGQRPDAGLFA